MATEEPGSIIEGDATSRSWTWYIARALVAPQPPSARLGLARRARPLAGPLGADLPRLAHPPSRAPPPQPAGAAPQAPDVHAELAALARPRKHYQWYYATRAAAGDLERCPQGVHAFLRAYFHMKSADWKGNRPFSLASWSAHELAKMPTYYIMDLDKTMAESVGPEMPLTAADWLPEDELAVYSAEYARTGFQGGLQWYRCRTEGRNKDLDEFSGRPIEVPSMFIAGSADWGVYQVPGAFERMRQRVLARMRGCHLVEGAGHWVQQERPEVVNQYLTEFLG